MYDVFFLQKDGGSASLSEASQRKIPETESFIEALPVSAYCVSFSHHRVFLLFIFISINCNIL